MEASEVIALPLQAFFATFIDRIIAFNRSCPGYLALALGSTISSPLSLVLSNFQQSLFTRQDALMAAYWPHSSSNQRRLPLLVSYRLFLALLPLAMQGDREHQRAFVHEMKVVLYRYWEPIVSRRSTSEMLIDETHARVEEREQTRDPQLFDTD
jgi:hypothetical protein